MKKILAVLLFVSIGVFAQSSKKDIESLPIPNKQIFKNLKAGDTIVLNYSATGCFSLIIEKMVFTKSDNILKASIFSKDKLITSHVISHEDFKTLIAFEEKARYMHKNSGCTNSENYAFLVNNKLQYNIVDGTCSWNGYSLLKKEIFNISMI